MATLDPVEIGTVANDGTGDPLRTAFDKLNDNDAALNVDLAALLAAINSLTLDELADVDASVASPSDGDIIVFRTAGNDWVLEEKPAGGSASTIEDLTNVTVTGVADNEVLAFDSGTSEWINQTPAEAGLAAASHTHAVSDLTDPQNLQLPAAAITSGTFADARIAESNVTQHRAALLPIVNADLDTAAAWTFKMRNAATTGVLTDAALANINEEVAPAAGDFLMGFLATGEIRKFDVDSVGGGEANTASNVGTDGVGVFDDKVLLDLQFRHIAPASTKITTVLNGADIDLDIVEANLVIPAASITSGTLADARISASSVAQHRGNYTATDGTAGGSNITVITHSLAGGVIKFDQALTLDNAFGAGRWVVLNNVHATSTLVVTVEAGAGGTGLINGATTYSIPPGGEILLRCFANAGDEPQCDARGDAATLELGGRELSGNLVGVASVSGVLTGAHSGQRLTTSGAITVPTTTGWWAIVRLGGDHDITFNGTTLDVSGQTWTTGDKLAITVTSATTIEIERTGAADIVDESDFA